MECDAAPVWGPHDLRRQVGLIVPLLQRTIKPAPKGRLFQCIDQRVAVWSAG